MNRRLAATAAILLMASLGTPAVAGTTATNLSNGAELSVSMTTPITADKYLVPQGQTGVDVPIAGTASVGKGQPNAAWVYVIDVSGSTTFDPTGCGGTTTVLDCEKTAVKNLNTQVVASGSALEIGLAVFGTSAATADMTSAPGDALVVAPNIAGVETVVNSVFAGGVGQFTPKSVGGSTNFSDGLAAAATIVGATTALQKNVVFLSDGVNTVGSGFAATLANLASVGVKIYPFAVGTGAVCGAAAGFTLTAMAVATGTTCTPVPDPANLPSIITNVISTTLDSLTLTVDAAPETVDSLLPSLPANGPVSATYGATANAQIPGTHVACATATGTGPAGNVANSKNVQVCESYDVFAFSVSPPTAINELGAQSTHAITATLVGPAGKLAGFPVAFAVTGQNAGTLGTCIPIDCKTNAAGIVTFTYSVPVAPASLGSDTITATVTVGTQKGAAIAGKLWRDTTPPVAACPASVNPGGSIPQAPGNGGQGQNQDGFYKLAATDDVWPSAGILMYVTDAGSGVKFGPFPVGTNIKYTQATGATPSQKPMTGAVQWQLKGKGDASVTAVDGSGNVSSAASCLVPRPPK